MEGLQSYLLAAGLILLTFLKITPIYFIAGFGIKLSTLCLEITSLTSQHAKAQILGTLKDKYPKWERERIAMQET